MEFQPQLERKYVSIYTQEYPHQRRQKQILYFKRNSPIILNMKNNHAWCSYQIYLPRLNKTYVALISSCERFLTFGKNVKGRVSHIYFDWSKLKTQNDVNRKKHCSYPFTSKLTKKVYLRFCQMQGLHKCSPPYSSWIEVKDITEWLNSKNIRFPKIRTHFGFINM